MKLTVQIVIYNNKSYLPKVFANLYAQSFKDFNVIAVICGNQDGSKEYLEQNYPDVTIIDPQKNLGFAGGHNLAFSRSDSEFVFLLNPDLVMEPDYLSSLLKSFDDPRVASVTGKLLQIDMAGFTKKNTLDSTGIALYSSGRAKDRGQHEVDLAQYDSSQKLPAVSGAGPMYRRSALELLKKEQGEIFDSNFFMYWEDVDLGLRLLHQGFFNYFQPQARAYHGRGTGSSKSGVKKIREYLSHRKTVSLFTKRLNFKNHFFLVVKNFPKITLKVIFREIAMFFYVLIFETQTLTVLPEIFKALPVILNKRRIIQSSSKISPKEFQEYFSDLNS